MRLLSAVAAVAFASTASAAAAATTTTTTYRYNADGAPSAITTRIDGGDPSTVYLNWDNFTPDAGDPTTGSVRSGDGNLAAIGSSPGAADSSFRFDRRDRLVGFSKDGIDLTYEYHADGTMASSSTADGDGLQFYYDGSSPSLVRNMRQISTGLWSSRFGPVRQLSDGTEQALLLPRKDTAGLYDPAAHSLTPYRYEAFGASSAASQTARYDVRDNPWRYAGEYRDAISKMQHLGARWYDAEVPTFLSRDPLAHTNRYGYGDANPVMMVDPSGMRASFFGSFEQGLQTVVDNLDRGVQGHVMRLLFSPVLYPLEILAHPGSFWRQVEHDPIGDAFLGASIAFGIGFAVSGATLAVREFTQTGIGLLQSTSSGFDDFQRGSKDLRHFDGNAFVEGLENAVGVSSLHGIGGARYDPFSLSIQDAERLRANLGDGQAIIFRVRDRTGWPGTHTSPLLESANLGLYHSMLVAITKDDTMVTELADNSRGGTIFTHFERGEDVATTIRNMREKWGGRFSSGNFTFQRALDVESFGAAELRKFNANPLGIEMVGFGRSIRTAVNDPEVEGWHSRYNLLFRNCHTHEQAVLRLIRQRG